MTAQVAAVVLNWRDPDRTLRCVRSLIACDKVGAIFLVDNGATGALRALVESQRDERWSRVELIEHLENRGFSGGVNRGLERAIAAGYAEVLAINNDATIDDRSLSSLVDVMRLDRRLALVAPAIRSPDGEVESVGEYLNPWLGTSGRSAKHRPIDFITWACVLISSNSLKSVGMLDESFFMYWEDVDFSLRARAEGWDIRVVESAFAEHETSSNRKSYPVAIKSYHTWSSVVFARKHRGAWRVGNMIWLTVSFCKNVIVGQREAIRGIRLGIRMANERRSPAWESPLRQALFDDSRGSAA